MARALGQLGAAIDLVLSPAARRTLALEVGPDAEAELVALARHHHAADDFAAPIAWRSCPVAGMIVAPCAMRSLTAIAHALDNTLLARAAAVQLKERRPLILLTREAPLTLAHLRNLPAVTEMGGIILPPVPAFYLHPQARAWQPPA